MSLDMLSGIEHEYLIERLIFYLCWREPFLLCFLEKAVSRRRHLLLLLHNFFPLANGTSIWAETPALGQTSGDELLALRGDMPPFQLFELLVE